MTTLIASNPADPGPITPDWTIGQLLEWLSDDVHQHEATLQHPLARIEAALTGAHWERTPSTVALIRSIAAAVRKDPARGRIRISELSPRQTPRTSERIPQLV